jgi:hypothetical protein
MRTSMVYGLLAVAVGSIACGSANSGVQTAYNATVNGFYVVPQDSSAGSATLALTVSGLSITGTLTISGTAPGGTVGNPPVANAYTVGHIHVGTAGSNGNVVLNLCGSGTLPACSGSVAINYTATNSGNSPMPGAAGNGVCGSGNCPTFNSFVSGVEGEGYYVQVHSTLHPNGEIRGQILRTAQTF